MDTIVFTFTELYIEGGKILRYNLPSPLDPDSPNPFDRNTAIYFQPFVDGTIEVDGETTEECRKFTLNIGGIEWIVTAAHVDSSGDEPVETPYQLSARTYVDAYGKLHVGDEVENDDKIFVTAKLVNRNPSGSGYELVAENTITLQANFDEIPLFGNFNDAETMPYIAYQYGDSLTPAAGSL